MSTVKVRCSSDVIQTGFWQQRTNERLFLRDTDRLQRNTVVKHRHHNKRSDQIFLDVWDHQMKLTSPLSRRSTILANSDISESDILMKRMRMRMVWLSSYLHHPLAQRSRGRILSTPGPSRRRETPPTRSLCGRGLADWQLFVQIHQVTHMNREMFITAHVCWQSLV